MTHKYDISLIQETLENVELSLKEFFKSYELMFKNSIGEIKEIKIKDVDGVEKTVPNLSDIDITNTEDVEIILRNKNSIYIGINRNMEVLALSIFIEDSSNLIGSILISLSEKLNTIFTLSVYHIRNRKYNTEVFKELNRYEEEYDSLNFYYIASVSWINIYPRKKIRDNRYLPTEDEFYLNIPADEVKKLDKESIMVILHKNPEEQLDSVVTKTKTVIEYYRNYLSKLGIWKIIKWWPDWREKNKDLLKEKGIILPEYA